MKGVKSRSPCKSEVINGILFIKVGLNTTKYKEHIEITIQYNPEFKKIQLKQWISFIVCTYT